MEKNEFKGTNGKLSAYLGNTSYAIFDENGNDVLNVEAIGNIDKVESNAVLFTAAPELLDALINYHNILVCNKPFSGKDLDKAENAINKALGKEE